MARNQPFAFCFVLESNKLKGTNYAHWIHNLRIVLRAEKKEEVLDTPLQEEPAKNATANERTAYKKAIDNGHEVHCLMLASMEPELQMQFETNCNTLV